MLRRLLTLIFLLLISANVLQAQSWRSGDYRTQWGDSLLKTMTLREQIAQMMMVAAWSNKGPEHVAEVEELISRYRIGGLCFFQGHPLKQAYLTNYYQQLSRTPMLIAIDGEWGLAMRLRDIEKYPYQMTLGAAGDDSLIYRTGMMIGAQCRRMGIHINFAPSVDVNTNPDNPIIGFRSFGENPADVSRQGDWMMKGMQDAGIIACAKHFPGHGDSEADSHLELPRISADRPRLDSVELLPFRRLISHGVKSVMTGHLEVPALDTVPHRPSSLSPIVVNDLLKNDLAFKGLIITDALNMKGVSSLYGRGYAEAAAILAGNDIALFPENVPKAIDLIVEMVRSGKLDSAEISARVRKILYFKQQSGLDRYKPVETRGLMDELKTMQAENIQKTTAYKSVTVVTDRHEWLPLLQHTRQKTAWWAIGKAGAYPFGSLLQKYQKIDPYFTYRDSGYEVFQRMSDSLGKHYEYVIVSIHDQNLWGKKSVFLPQQVVQHIYSLAEKTQVIVVVFGNLYVLHNLPNLPCAIVAYEDDPWYQKAVADILYGEKPSQGSLPATAWKGYHVGQGVKTAANMSLGPEVSSPQAEGMSRDFSAELDSLLAGAVRGGNMPGGQLMVLKNGRSIYHRAYGSFYYDSFRPVRKSDIYDVASITKIASTTLSIMRLWERNMIRLDAHIHEYLPELNGSNKAKLTIRQILVHEAGLQPFIPFYKDALNVPGLFSRKRDSLHTVEVSDSVWMRIGYRDTMWQQIVRSELRKKGDFVYSDLGFIMLGRVIERLTGMTPDQYAKKHFYRPLNLNRTTFRPTDTYYPDDIAPTTEDNYFRNQRIQGYVHDPAAAMMGGIAGHAGLFSNAADLAVIMQMLLNGGDYEGQKFFKPSTIREFTARQKGSHRGLGFDKPNGQPGNKANVSDKVPAELFGHSGFTGNWAWADPKNGMVFIFLSNRTYPDENNRKLIVNGIRSKAIDIVYNAL